MNIDWIPLEENEESKRFREEVEYLKQLIIKYTIMEKVKIPASHLRAGNLRLSEKLSIPILQMFSVEIDRVSFSSITAYGISLVETGIIDFNPIPLSDEWLKKYSFEKILRNEVEIWRVNNFELIKTRENTFFYSNSKQESVQIAWVHQLQNLYFAFYYKELELTGLDSKK